MHSATMFLTPRLNARNCGYEVLKTLTYIYLPKKFLMQSGADTREGKWGKSPPPQNYKIWRD